MKTGNCALKRCQHISKNMNFFLFNLQLVFVCMCVVFGYVVVSEAFPFVCVCSKEMFLFLKNISEKLFWVWSKAHQESFAMISRLFAASTKRIQWIYCYDLKLDSISNTRAFVVNEGVRLGHMTSILFSLGSASSCEEKRSHSSSVTEGRGWYNAAGPGSTFEMLWDWCGYSG